VSLPLALEWASQGCRVLPVNGSTKRPLIKAWQENCTTDEEQIREWWREYPQARVGIATGDGGFDVLDFDVSDGKPGLAQMERLLDLGVLVPGTFWLVSTPSGGRHVYLRGTDQRNKQNDKSVPGVDFRGVGGMVLAFGNPGYRRITGASLGRDDLKTVDWGSVVAALAPEPVVDRSEPLRHPIGVQDAQHRPVTSKLVAPSRAAYDNPVGEESPLDWFCSHNDLRDLLRADGWQYAYEHGGRDYWVRPGKDPKDGVSANVMINPDGRQTLMNFSSSVDLPTDRGLSAAQYWAYTRHRGDMRAAAGEIRRTLMPRRTPPGGHGTNQTAVGCTDAPPAAPVAPETPSSGQLVPADKAGIPEMVQQFWKARPELAEVYWQAQISDTSPWAVLGTVLACVAGRVGPHVRIPPKGGVGAAASLNILVAINGDSGEGKGVSGQVARRFCGAPYPPWRKPGTGQGIAAMFTEQTKEGPVQSNDTVILNVTEITQLGAHMDQRGATITSTLLEVYMGEELGEHYANKELRRPVREGQYRLALVAGVQPDNAAILFDHAVSGLPQRFLWLPAFWEAAVVPEGLLEPPAPGPAMRKWHGWSAIHPGTLDETLQLAEEWSPSSGLAAPSPGKKKAEPEAVSAPSKDELLVTYAPGVRRHIETDRRRRRNEIRRKKAEGIDAADPDSHVLLTRIKIATYLAIWLDNTTYISDEIWDLSAVPIWISNRTRIEAEKRIQKAQENKSAGRARAMIAQKAMVEEADDHKRNAVYINALDRLVHVLGSTPGWLTTRAVNAKLNSREKKAWREAGYEMIEMLGDLVLAEKVETQEVQRGGNTAVEWRAK